MDNLTDDSGFITLEMIEERNREIERLQLELKYKLDQSERIKNLEAEIERLRKRNTLLEDVAVAAAKCHPHMCGKVFDPMSVEAFEEAYDKLREVSDE